MRHDKINPKQESGPLETDIVERIIASLQGISFGSVEIVIHEGRIVQIERKEKVRL